MQRALREDPGRIVTHRLICTDPWYADFTNILYNHFRVRFFQFNSEPHSTTDNHKG